MATLLQTFLVTADEQNSLSTGSIQGGQGQNASGRFVTSLDLYFAEKDDTLPLTVEIRNTSNGYPGPNIIPFGRVVKEPSEINISTDATTATTFTFPSPVFLMNDIEYCFAVDCQTPDYKLWISRLGETTVDGSRGPSEQPHVGVLFKGHNGRTWAPSLAEDIKFVLKCAKFTQVSSGVLTLNNDAVPTRTLDSNPLVFTNGNTALLVNHKNHHMYTITNNVTISDVKSGASTTLASALDSSATSLTLTSGTDFDDTSGKYAYDTSSQWWIKINDEVMKYTAISSTAVSSVTRAQDSTTAVAHASGTTVELYMLHRVPFTEINKTHTSLANIGIDSYTVVLTSSPSISGGTDTASAGGIIVKATENACYDTGRPIIGSMEVPGTELAALIVPMSSTSPSGSQTSFIRPTTAGRIIPLNENVDYKEPLMVASTINETNENDGNKSLRIDIKMATVNADISPVIDTQRMSFVTVANRLDNIDSSADVYPTANFTSSTDPDGDSNSAIYMTKKVTLENSASALKVFFAAYRHSSAEIKLYHKTLRTDDASDFDDLGWVAFNSAGSPDNTVRPSLEKTEFKQYVYTAGVADDGSGTPLDEFVSFSIKIVMQGTNTAEPPRIKDLRCIALAL